ncbi:hypothetical protein L218DRAFT_1009568 [Marasmius fiardii PR-910]|nr:hypothetical protein L218DRAFT_1009568 [Marasmius fiardii PR-910]
MPRAVNIVSAPDTDEIFGILRETSQDLISSPQDSLVCTMQWVAFASQSQDFGVLSEAYEHAIQFLRHYLAIGPTMRLQYDALSRHAEILSLPIDAASHFIQQGNTERAIEVLDTNLVERFESTCIKLCQISTAEGTFASFSSNLAHTPMGLSYNNVLPQKHKLLQDYDEILN